MKTNWWAFCIGCLGATILIIAICAVLLPECIPTGNERHEWCVPPENSVREIAKSLTNQGYVPPEDSVREIAKNLTDQGYVLYVYGGCHWCAKQLAEFGDAAGSLTVRDCAMAHQAYRFENVSEAKAAYNWVYMNGSAIKASNLTYANLTVEYDGYGILGYANRNETCAALNISAYPTWVFPNGTRVVGLRTLDVIRGWVK